jgi:hypothetical protein
MYYRENGKVTKHKVNKVSLEKFKYGNPATGTTSSPVTPTQTPGPTNGQSYILYIFIAITIIGIILLIASLVAKYNK